MENWIDLRNLDLSKETFDFQPLIMNGQFSLVPFIDTKKNKVGKRVDFGTLLLGWDENIPEDESQRVLELSVCEGDNIFICPSDWKPCHIARAFGLFPSVNQAIKNGWSKEDFAPGCHEIALKIKKARGTFWIHKIGE